MFWGTPTWSERLEGGSPIGAPACVSGIAFQEAPEAEKREASGKKGTQVEFVSTQVVGSQTWYVGGNAC